nr:uncharacterized protein LOC127485397 [Oryctolagus cuniculus]
MTPGVCALRAPQLELECVGVAAARLPDTETSWVRARPALQPSRPQPRAPQPAPQPPGPPHFSPAPQPPGPPHFSPAPQPRTPAARTPARAPQPRPPAPRPSRPDPSPRPPAPHSSPAPRLAPQPRAPAPRPSPAPRAPSPALQPRAPAARTPAPRPSPALQPPGPQPAPQPCAPHSSPALQPAPQPPGPEATRSEPTRARGAPSARTETALPALLGGDYSVPRPAPSGGEAVKRLREFRRDLGKKERRGRQRPGQRPASRGMTPAKPQGPGAPDRAHSRRPPGGTCSERRGRRQRAAGGGRRAGPAEAPEPRPRSGARAPAGTGPRLAAGTAAAPRAPRPLRRWHLRRSPGRLRPSPGARTPLS